MEKRTNIRMPLDIGLLVANDLQPDLSSAALADYLGARRAYLLRRSVDARKKRDVHFVVTAGIGTGADAPHAVVPLKERPLPALRATGKRPVVVGMGPAGLFAALELAEAGLRPLVIERGVPVEQRTRDVERFMATRVLDPKSNVQFGEGGAGTFSDGKLTTGKNSPLINRVLETFVAAGAPAEILWQAKPHIGTDVLATVVASMRERIIACGGKVSFDTQLCGMRFASDGTLSSIELASATGTTHVDVSQLVLATGHSARDTFAMLRDAGLALEQKPFSIGVRIEHVQHDIDLIQYGDAAGHAALGAADYKLSCHLPSGRSVYTFCMCPGGEVVAAASEQARLCVNGMSRHARAGVNANAAVLCSVDPGDFADAHDPLAGIALQRLWEQAAFEAGGGDWHAPCQTVGDYLGARAADIAAYRTMNQPEPSYPLGVSEADLRTCLPGFASDALCEALPALDRKMRGFAHAKALLTGIESRSSSPVRVKRDAGTLMACGHAGVWPCGEGAGYAGGIMSAAIDGLRCAAALMSFNDADRA